MGAGDTLGQLTEQRLHDLDELRGLDDVQDLLQLVEEHHLLGAVGLGPVLEQRRHSLQRNQSLSTHGLGCMVYGLDVLVMGWMYGNGYDVCYGLDIWLWFVMGAPSHTQRVVFDCLNQPQH